MTCFLTTETADQNGGMYAEHSRVTEAPYLGLLLRMTPSRRMVTTTKPVVLICQMDSWKITLPMGLMVLCLCLKGTAEREFITRKIQIAKSSSHQLRRMCLPLREQLCNLSSLNLNYSATPCELTLLLIKGNFVWFPKGRVLVSSSRKYMFVYTIYVSKIA